MKIHAISGYNEVGKNMTALEVGEDVILFDSGLFLPAIVGVEEREKNPNRKRNESIRSITRRLIFRKTGFKR
jgi:mRNA degradation ribonuclease J1/J2